MIVPHLNGACMSPENTHKLMGFYMEVLILGVILLVHGFCFLKLFTTCKEQLKEAETMY